MRDFKKLTTVQKKRAVDQSFDLVAQDLAKGFGGKSFSKLSPKKQQDIIDLKGYLCGCAGCLTSILYYAKNNQAIKEFILGEALVIAENAYYPESTDTVFAVD